MRISASAMFADDTTAAVRSPQMPHASRSTATSDAVALSRFRRISENRRSEFIERRLPGRHFFAHRAYYLPKCGPDALYLAQAMCGRKSAAGHVELVLFADPVPDALPREIFFDDDLAWHRQQFGKPGHVAFAYLVEDGDRLYGLNYVSDLVQRISRRKEHATRVEKLFHGWRHMLFNGILNFAVERGLKTIYSPASELAMAHTDKTRTVGKELFERIYDRTVTERFEAKRSGDWWLIDVKSNRDRRVVPETGAETIGREKTICICHDIERGLGHEGIDGKRAEIADRIASEALARMLRCEKAAKINATYSVVGCFFDEVRDAIQSQGHCLAFHSFDHAIRPRWRLTRRYWRLRRMLAPLWAPEADGRESDQLYRCRLVDRRVRGFRPPQSRITPEWDDDNLVFRNFEWCATSSPRLGAMPRMQNHLAKIPIRLDDFPLYQAGMPFHEWERRLVVEIEEGDFIAFGLHDCYADLWLPHYPALLARISRLGKFLTLDAVADRAIFASAI